MDIHAHDYPEHDCQLSKAYAAEDSQGSVPRLLLFHHVSMAKDHHPVPASQRKERWQFSVQICRSRSYMKGWNEPFCLRCQI
jgi:hypothetical protein